MDKIYLVMHLLLKVEDYLDVVKQLAKSKYDVNKDIQTKLQQLSHQACVEVDTCTGIDTQRSNLYCTITQIYLYD